MDVPELSVCALVAYDGTDYHGFQYQVDVPTVQGTLEEALRSFTDLRGRVIGSGRTDTGVHANGQVISATIRWRHSLADLQNAWNAHLPASICTRQVSMAPETFHPRFSAVRRTYRYRVYDAAGDNGHRPSRSPLTDRFALYEIGRLDTHAMVQATKHFVGEHDFATFGQPPQGENTVRTVYSAELQEVTGPVSSLDEFPGRALVFTVTATAFLRHMVRNLVGSLLEVGRGRWSGDDIVSALNARDRSYCAAPAPANGLTLERVDYPEHLNVLLN